jgi:hypothetical protein
MEGILGRLAGGAFWGLGAGIVLSVLNGRWGGGEGKARRSAPGRLGLRRGAKSAMRAYLAVSDRLRETAAEARESLDDLYAEARAERGGAAPPAANGATRPAGARPRRRRATA